MIRKRLLGTAMAAAIVFFEGCATSPPLTPHELGSVGREEWVMVEPFGGSSVRIKDVSIDTAVLSGLTSSGVRFAIPLNAVHAIRLRKTNMTLLIAYIPAVAVAAWLAHGSAAAPSRPKTQVESCPFIYVDDGRDLVFEAEPYGGAIVPALERTEWTPLTHLKDVDGQYRIRIANELDETQHIDEARLLVVDHPTGTEAAADPTGQIFVYRDPAPPSRAADAQGHDLTAVLREADNQAWQSGYDDMEGETRQTLRDALVLEFTKPAGARTATLLVNGATSLWGAQVARQFLALRGSQLPDWYRELDTSAPARLALLSWFAREGLYLAPIEVETPEGWRTRGTLFGSGPFAYKTTAYSLDVSDVPGDTLRVRLPVPVNFWVFNSVAVDYGQPPSFDTIQVETSTVQDARGRATRSLLAETDGNALVMSEKGDHSDLVFPAPPARPGQDRTVFLQIGGYYDIHLPAEGQPQEAVLQRLLHEPGYTLRFAFERYQEKVARSRTTAPH